ncbi:GatB/YqeY domain-containing protein [Azospirillum sp. 412522]|nr:GatB/YqeY domain-containing protein [Azospirillum sp. 412522]MBY6261493.1 GatB/YqeY domain-containing protein [Azospirillum sp. 412522]
MTLRTQFTDSLKDAMRAKEQRAVSALRLILTELKNRDIEARTRGATDGIDDAGILSMLQSMVKQRNESAGMYEQGGRPELAQQERDEIAVIERFLPRQMNEEEAAAAVDAVVTELGATGIQDMGKVMAGLKARYAGQMDFAKAGVLVKARLFGK